MKGAVIGDIVGSVYEFDNIKTTEFELLTPRNFITDDTVMTVAGVRRSRTRPGCGAGSGFFSELSPLWTQISGHGIWRGFPEMAEWALPETLLQLRKRVRYAGIARGLCGNFDGKCCADGEAVRAGNP